MLELVSPAGSAEGVTAAIQSGADAVYLSFGGISSSAGCDLTEDEFGRAAEFVRVRGAKIYAVIDLSPFDEDFSAAVENARRACRMGADAVIVHDVGLIWALRRAVPSMPIHTGPRLGIHNLDGVKLCAAMGVKRVSLSPELSSSELEYICKNSPVEIEIAVHGPSCASFGGHCLLSAFGSQSAMRGVCPRPCLSSFSQNGRGRHPLAMKDICLINHLESIKSCGAAAVRIDGRERRPEYCAAVTGVYARALSTGKSPSKEELKLLSQAFPAGGFTDGYFTGTADSLTAVPGEEPQGDSPFYSAIRKSYLNREFQRVPVQYSASVSLGGPLKLTVQDDRGNLASGEGGKSELAFHQELTTALLQTELYKTGGTPFLCTDVRCGIEKGIYFNPQDIGPLRDELLGQLMKKRVYLEPRAEGAVPMLPPVPNVSEVPVLTASFLYANQLSHRILELAPPVLYLPLEEIIANAQMLEPYLSADNISVCAVLPHFIRDSELGEITELLLKARQLGVEQVLAGNLGHIIFARKLGFDVRGDYSLNVRNSSTLAAMSGFNLLSLTLSPEMSAPRVRTISKRIPSELIVYGRQPLIYTDMCVVKNMTGVCSCDSFSGISDNSGFLHPVTHGFKCRNTVWSYDKLFLAGRSREYLASGLWGVRLCFTTENAAECAAITERYLEMNDYEPSSSTRGLF
ncbi:MAG: DUF3656 domain-containing protein [Oscillospiraceae bacterium]